MNMSPISVLPGDGDEVHEGEIHTQMRPFTTVSGPAVPLMRANIDTDLIIRIERMTGPAKSELGAYALETLRYRDDGSVDPNCALNRPVFRNAPILLAGDNFGCGSSREAAVWALAGMGVRCVIAQSFGDIFFSNCFQNGILPIQLPESRVYELAALSETGEPMQIDLLRCVIVAQNGNDVEFSVDPQRRDALLNGLDDIALTLRDDTAIRAWQLNDRQSRPWVWLPEAVRAASANAKPVGA